LTSAKSKQRSNQHIETQQAARAAIDLMTRDIRTAGYGADRDWATPSAGDRVRGLGPDHPVRE